jgi:hypothetical protein
MGTDRVRNNKGKKKEEWGTEAKQLQCLQRGGIPNQDKCRIKGDNR